MSSLTRRSLLSGLVTTSGLMLIGCKGHNQGPRRLQRLNVVLHGLMAIVVSHSNPDRGIKLIFPDVDFGDDNPHVYLAGSVRYLKPRDCYLIPFPKGTSQILGLQKGTFPDFSNADNFYLPNGDGALSVNEGDKRCILLPWPDSVASLNPLYLYYDPQQCYSSTPLISCVDSTNPNAKLRRISTIHVLSYNVNEQGPILIGPDGKDLGWNPCTAGIWDPCPSIVSNLHIFAEPRAPVGADHAMQAFDKLMGIINYGSGTLYNYFKFNNFDVKLVKLCSNIAAPYGIDPALDLLNLPQLKITAGGEMANCVAAIIETH